MDIVLNGKDRVHMQTDLTGPEIDVERSAEDIISIDLYATNGIVEVRKKGTYYKVFQFLNSEYKKDFKYGWWDDAEVMLLLI